MLKCRHISPVFFLWVTLRLPKPPFQYFTKRLSLISPSSFPVFLQTSFPYFPKPYPLFLQASFPFSLGPSSAADHEQRLFCPTGDGKKFEDASSACLLTYIDIVKVHVKYLKIGIMSNLSRKKRFNKLTMLTFLANMLDFHG